jgi:hypothetical protein
MRLKNFYLTERLIDLIKQESARLQVSEAELLRRILDWYFEDKSECKK